MRNDRYLFGPVGNVVFAICFWAVVIPVLIAVWDWLPSLSIPVHIVQ
ncbi:MAG: hypothetical protein J2P47_03775 [Acetobacteraceae bacterium]|nr:hypothetical protein [Acetobacteraceae bacterium]